MWNDYTNLKHVIDMQHETPDEMLNEIHVWFPLGSNEWKIFYDKSGSVGTFKFNDECKWVYASFMHG